MRLQMLGAYVQGMNRRQQYCSDTVDVTLLPVMLSQYESACLQTHRTQCASSILV